MYSFTDLPERIRKRVTIDADDCWLWAGAVGSSGYGKLVWNGKTPDVHRLIFLLVVGEIPGKLVVDHICHNKDELCLSGKRCKHKLCVNPNHLMLATRAGNVLSGRGLSANNARKIKCDKGHEYNQVNTKIEATGGRRCLVCRRLQDKKRRPRGIPRKPKGQALNG